MLNNLEKITKLIKSDLEYLRLKALPEEEYKAYLAKVYEQKTGETLNIDFPKKYTEKMQYAKLYLNTPLKTRLSDKYLVRDWVEEKIGSEYLIPLLGKWDNFSEIEFDNLPNSFVLKLNSGSGTNIIVKDKKNFRYTKSRLKFNRWMKKNYAFSGDLQLHYADIKPKIIAEKYVTDSNGELNDYRFMCFDGKVYFCIVDVPQKGGPKKRNIYDLNWELQKWQQGRFSNTKHKIEKPANFDLMVTIAEELCKGFSHVRVDLYNVDGKVYFGEMTFTNAGGHQLIYPEEYNYKLGDLWKI